MTRTGLGPGIPTLPAHRVLLICANYTTIRWGQHWDQKNPTEPNPALLSIPIRTGTADEPRYWNLLLIEVDRPTLHPVPVDDIVRGTVRSWAATGTIWTMYDDIITSRDLRPLLQAGGPLALEPLTVEAALLAPTLPARTKPDGTEGATLRDWLYTRIQTALQHAPQQDR